jgi:guanosine-3',5'-bis(diphosphate) 3'-pyrophosphohydrolase
MYLKQDLYQKTILFAGEKHKNQKLPIDGLPYVIHLSNVAMEVMFSWEACKDFDVEYAVQLALLHDTLEDTETSYEELEETFGIEVSKGVFALTKDGKNEKEKQMKDSIEKILACSKEVGIVKMSDRITNLQKPPKHWDNKKIISYREEAKYILESLKSSNKYLSERLALKIDEYEKYIKECLD